MDIMERFLTFAEQSPTAFHAIANLKAALREAGYHLIRALGKALGIGRIVGTAGDTLFPQGVRQRLILGYLRQCRGGEADDGCHE